jgi:hypothetical protein
MKQFLEIMLKDIQREGFTPKEYFVYGVVAPLGLIALIGFAGPRVIKETIKRDLPEGFQRSEFLLDHGFLDFIVPRPELKDKLAKVLSLLRN